MFINLLPCQVNDRLTPNKVIDDGYNGEEVEYDIDTTVLLLESVTN